MSKGKPIDPLETYGLTKEKALDLLRQMWEIRMFEERVYDLLGQRVATLIDKSMPAGAHTVEFRADNLGTGVYIYQLSGPDVLLTKKMVLIK